ncbi:MAG: large-conductance mechanosensitive channel protein MscL [Bacteroidetes bacterium]|nr:large-conductance mechanosensitive channel protein MscL [Bacteroidota bacterium]NCQ10746.1 large-conductance mechanosensitive channel protein MscL [Bacteroidota bacterium]
MNIIKEFKEFAIKGNMFDMAIGIIIGTGFNKIVSSLVNDLILPSLSLLIGQVNFQNLSLVLRDKQVDSTGVVIQELVAIKYGNFLQVLVDFTIIALSAFLVIKLFNSFRKKAEDAKDVTVSTPKDIELLSEIRDLLKVKG